LALNLREKKGLAYSVSSAVRWDKDFGWFYVYLGTSPQNFEVARKGILEEIQRLKAESVGSEELEKAKNDLWGSLLMSRLSSVNQAFYMSIHEYLGMGYEWDEKLLQNLKKVSSERVNSAFQKWIDTENYLLVTAGKKQAPQESRTQK
jgi:zinc protease